MNEKNEENTNIINKEKINEFKANNNHIFLEKLENRVRNKLIKRYEKPISYFDIKMINDILYNEKTHYVEMFKEYLIYEDYNEFLKQYYNESFLYKKLEKILNFYDKYSKIFPNYTVLRESKYLYKNIKRKQKIINLMNENVKMKYSEDDNNSESESCINTIFNSKVINSIYTGHNSDTLNRTDSNVNDNRSLNCFINKITLYENQQKKINKEKKRKKDEFSIKNKNEEQIIYKKISNLFFTSFINQPNNSINKNNIKKKEKIKIGMESNNSNVISHKLNFKPIPKQKSSTNIIYKNKKKCFSIKHKNIIKKNNSNNNIVESKNSLNKKNNINTNNTNTNSNNSNKFLFNNVNNSYRGSNMKNLLDYDKYKKIILSTNTTSSHKILTERVFSSPRNTKNNLSVKKNQVSNSRAKNRNNNMNKNNKFIKRNISSNILRKIQSNISKKKKINMKSNNHFREEKKIFKCQINKQNQKKLINNFNPDSINKFYSNNLSNLNIKNKNNRNNSTFNNKNKVINNYNIMNGVMNNSTQINIYTGNDLIRSLNMYWNSIIKSSKTPTGLYDHNFVKLKNSSKSLSKRNKRVNNSGLKKFIERHMKEKKSKEPYTERNSNNEKFLKLLDIYCRDAKKYKSTNIKKSLTKNKLNKSHNYNNKSNLEVKSLGESKKIYNNIDLLKDKEKNHMDSNVRNLMYKKFNYYKKK